MLWLELVAQQFSWKLETTNELETIFYVTWAMDFLAMFSRQLTG